MKYLFLFIGIISCHTGERVENDSFSRYSNLVDVNKKRPDDEREFRTITLDNQLQALLISDPSLKQSSASVDVGVGSMENPDDVEGLAHFLEHMLFQGTTKYPDASEFSAYLAKFQGYSNAYTDKEDTNYHFTVNHDGFEGALDRFAQFFIAPIFNQDNVNREMNAVHSEYQKNIQLDNWREDRIDQITAKNGHPYRKFTIGNLTTLKGASHEKLLSFHEKYYSSNIMKLVVLSPLSLSKQESLVKDLFSKVTNKKISRPQYEAQLYDPKDLPILTKIKPVQNIQELTLSFLVPPAYQYWETKPHDLLSFLVGDEGVGSLASLLKSEALVTTLQAGVDDQTYTSEMKVKLELTQKGLREVDRIIGYFFSYIDLITKSGLPPYVFNEEKTIKDLQFVYKDHQEGINYVSFLSRSMQLYPADNLLKRMSLYFKYSLDDFKKILSFITPDNMRVTVIDPHFEGKQREKFFGISYTTSKYDLKKMAAYRKDNLKLALPPENKYIPTNLSYFKDEKSEVPKKLFDDEFGDIWFQQDRDFNLPKGEVDLDIVVPSMKDRKEEKVLRNLYVRALNESLNEWKYPIDLAGIDYAIHATNRGIKITVEGFSDKIPEVIKDLLERLDQITISEPVFLAIRDQYKRELSNFDFDNAYEQADTYFEYLVNNLAQNPLQYRKKVDSISLSHVKKYAKTFGSNVYLDGLIYGNFHEKDFKYVISAFLEKYHPSEIPVAMIPTNRNIILPPGKSYSFSVPTKTNNSAWAKYVYFGKRNPKLDAILRVFKTYTADKFFADLRTKQQLGYIVHSDVAFKEQTSGLFYLIQSGTFGLDKVQKASNEWIDEHVQNLKDMTDAEFEQIRSELVKKYSQAPKTIDEKFALLFDQAINLDGDFDYRKSMVEELKRLNKGEFVAAIQRQFEKSNLSELTILTPAQNKGAPKSGVAIQDPETFKSGSDWF